MGKLWRLLLSLSVLAFIAALLPCASASETIRIYRVGGPELASADVLAGKFRGQEVESEVQAFTPNPENRGWWRIEFTQGTERMIRPILYLEALNLIDTQLWLPGAESSQSISHRSNISALGFSPRILAVEINRPIKAGESAYWRIMTREVSSIAVGLESERPLRKIDARKSRYFNLIEGTLIALIFAGLVLSLTMREWPFLLLTVGTFFSLLFIMADNGDIYYYDLFVKWGHEVPLQRIFGMTAFTIMAYFSYIFLDMPRNTPRIAILQRVLIAFMLSLLLASFLPRIQFHPLLPTLANFALIPASATGIIASLVLIKTGSRQGRLYLISWLPLMVLSIWRVIEITFKLPFNQWISIAYPASYMLAGVLLYLGLGERVLAYKRQRDANHMLARVDSLTDVYNRRALDERLQIAASQNAKSGSTMALLFADLDHFKSINDRYGHAAGDAVLKQVTLRIRDALRFGDVLGRYGGEEFVIALSDSDVSQAHSIAERIRLNVAEQPVLFDNKAIPVTLSIGIAMVSNAAEAVDVALQRADAALSISKQAGRNRVHIANQ
jgi:diguanylate cyclase (GGDEF)-like protein